MIKERLQLFRTIMADHGLDAYVIPTSDFHQSEYVGDYFSGRKYLSGFTGSAGTLVITKKEACLWTDGRYFIQAEHQLADTTITLMKQGEKNVPTVEEYLFREMNEHSTVGFDGRVVAAKWGQKLAEQFEKKDIQIAYDNDLVDEIWKDRPAMASTPIFLLEDKYAGASYEQKVAVLRDTMKQAGTTTHILTTLDDIAWLFNIRGNDVAYNPVTLAYAVITLDHATLYMDESKISKDMESYFAKKKISIMPYDKIYEDVKQLSQKEVVLYDADKVNYAIAKNIADDVKCISKLNPTVLQKAVKNLVEQKNLKNAHVKDGVAVTQFMYWLKNNVGKIAMDEITASDYLENCRRKKEGFIELSFDTISAYNANGAMMHYAATEESKAELHPEGFLLVDSGGQYYEGTTDITRTFALGTLTYEQKKHYTAVLRGMLNLANAKFLYGCSGLNLDILARGPMWNMNLDYKCGTGHGVGYLLNVHEAPNGFRWKHVPERNDSCVLEEGMVTTDEPGIYLEGQYGIRIENELLCKKGAENEYGQFMYFEPLTFAPIDLDAVLSEEMTATERGYLNAYHKQVFEKISPYLNEDEKEWLEHYTREI